MKIDTPGYYPRASRVNSFDIDFVFEDSWLLYRGYSTIFDKKVKLTIPI